MLIAEEVQAIYQTSRGAPCASSPRAAAHHRRRCRARCAPTASGASYYLERGTSPDGQPACTNAATHVRPACQASYQRATVMPRPGAMS